MIGLQQSFRDECTKFYTEDEEANLDQWARSYLKAKNGLVVKQGTVVTQFISDVLSVSDPKTSCGVGLAEMW